MRFAVMMRNTCSGNRSKRGAQAIFMPIFHTCQLHGVDPITFLAYFFAAAIRSALSLPILDSF